MDIESRLAELYPEMVEWRRHLHRYPELSYKEALTSEFIAGKLEQFGFAVRRNVGGHGLIGEVVGSRPGPTVALRADMDALPIQDEKTCDYSSVHPGVMHACGHDGHMAVLLGVAKLFSENREGLAGTVRLLFQPAEEVSPGGAVPMIADGALDGVDAIYGVHLWTPFPAGRVYSKSGPLMAAADEFSLEIKGKGGHGGLPHDTVDSLMVGAHAAVNLQTIVSRNMNPVDPTVISIGTFHAGTGFNVIAERARLTGTVRTFDPSVREHIRSRIEKVVKDTCSMFGAEPLMDYKMGYPPVINDSKETERFFRVAVSLFGEDNVKEPSLIMAGEDFSYYLQRVPGCFIFVGAGNPADGIDSPHHHPLFDIDETSLLHSARLLVHLALDRLSGTI